MEIAHLPELNRQIGRFRSSDLYLPCPLSLLSAVLSGVLYTHLEMNGFTRGYREMKFSTPSKKYES